MYQAELVETLETRKDPGAFWAKWIDVVVERTPPETDGGFHSLRINDQWRIVFRWSDAQAHDVRIVDYHRG